MAGAASSTTHSLELSQAQGRDGLAGVVEDRQRARVVILVDTRVGGSRDWGRGVFSFQAFKRSVLCHLTSACHPDSLQASLFKTGMEMGQFFTESVVLFAVVFFNSGDRFRDFVGWDQRLGSGYRRGFGNISNYRGG